MAAVADFEASKPCEVSAPGKVLIVGGYLVLQRAFPGLVLAASARFYSGAWWQVPIVSADKFRKLATCLLSRDFDKLPAYKTPETAPQSLGVTVISPQFHSRMHFQVQSVPPYSVTPEDGTTPNDFIQRAIACSMLAAYGSLPPNKLDTILLNASTVGARLVVSLQADNDFYSQLPHLEASSTTPSMPALQALPKCLPMLQDTNGKLQLSKTGMGSSAALTSSLTGALLQMLGVTAVPEDPGAASRCGMVLQAAPARHCMPEPSVVRPPAAVSRSVLSGENSVRLCHQVAQVAHCLAQGKVGSGFDVASACFGSVAYQRVGSAALGETMAAVASVLDSPEAVSSAAAVSAARRMASMQGWDYDLAPFALPPGVDLCLADVCGGSETPSMVRKVLAWLGAGGEAVEHWELLGASNAAAGAAMQRLTAMYNDDAAAYMAAVDSLCDVPAAEWAVPAQGTLPPPQWAQQLVAAASDVLKADCAARDAVNAVSVAAAAAAAAPSDVAVQFAVLHGVMRAARLLLRDMGTAAGVPIEPPSQTDLLDRTAGMPGVLAAGVPGAGGFDAVFALTLQGTQHDGKSQVAQAWLGTGEAAGEGGLVCPLLLHAEGCAECVVNHVRHLRAQATGEQ